jgi:hypothetical protein
MALAANSSNNTVYADADGHIAYFHPLFVPRRGGSSPGVAAAYAAPRLRRAFGHHDISGIQAHTDGAAAASAGAMGAQAFATGNHVAFAGTPDLRTAAHEAAHVVQQRGGVQLKGGVGEAGDSYEQHADAVADRVQDRQDHPR